jgi:hypothetical protein
MHNDFSEPESLCQFCARAMSNPGKRLMLQEEWAFGWHGAVRAGRFS